MFSALPMMPVCITEAKKFKTGRERAQRFVAVSWFLHWVSQRDVTRIVSTEVSVTILHLV